MQIQTLSVVVPTTGCVFACPMCVSRMRTDRYPNHLEKDKENADLYDADYLERLLFARDNGCNTAILTGEGEPLMNMGFIERFAGYQARLGDRRFRWVELQASGYRVIENLAYLRRTVRVSTIAISVVDLFDPANNSLVMQQPEKVKADLEEMCAKIKEHGFNLRISLNMTNLLDGRSPQSLFQRVKQLGANQVVFRVFYESGDDAIEQNRWVKKNKASDITVGRIESYIEKEGEPLEILSFGAQRYSLDGVSTVLDKNCMSKGAQETFRYLILRPDCRVYSRWDDAGSLVF